MTEGVPEKSGPVEFRQALAQTIDKLSRAKENRKAYIEKADHRVAKNRIAIFVIKSFCVCIFTVIAFIIYGASFSGATQWKEAYPPMMDILQKVFLPVVTLAFGFYNSNKGE